MWHRRELKEKSRMIMKKHYWRVIAICFLVAFIGGAYTNTFSAVRIYDSSREVLNVIQENNVFDFNDVQTEKPLDKLLEIFEVKSLKEEEYLEKSPYERGVFSAVFNHTMATGSIFSGVIAMILKPVFRGAWLSLISVVAGVVLLVLWWLLVSNVIRVGICRFFLEADTYRDTKGNKIFYIYRIRRFWKVAGIMAWRSFCQWLWALTIVGGWIKGYSYMMVPFLAAENPDIKAREAIKVSRQMMKGQKWKAFLIDCSFLGWSILSILTLGIVNIFYANPYKTGVKAELYLALRKQAIEEKAAYCSVFSDQYLTEPPSEEVLCEALLREAKMADTPDWQEKVEEVKSRELDVGKEYPTVLFSRGHSDWKYRFGIDYHCTYGVTGILMLFFFFSLVGWLWEVGLHLVQTGNLVNRGVLHGPWLPIYGSGGCLILLLLKKFRDRPVLTFSLTVLICGVVEYATSWYLERLHGVKWWDYSGYFLNINGRVCAEGLLVFGLGGCMFIYILAPVLMKHVIGRIPKKIRGVLCLILIFIFAADVLYSHKVPNTGQGITRPHASIFSESFSEVL